MKKIVFTSFAGVAALAFYLLISKPSENESPPVEPVTQKSEESSVLTLKEKGQEVEIPAHAIQSFLEPTSRELHKPMNGLPLNTEESEEASNSQQPMDEKLMLALEARRQHLAEIDLNQRLLHLKEGGEGGEQWLDDMHLMQEQWAEIADMQGISIDFSAWNCYALGCTSKIVFEKSADIAGFKLKLQQTSDIKNWNGTIYLSGAIETQPDVMEATWIFSGPIAISES